MAMDNVDISIIILSKNEAKYINRVLDRIFKQNINKTYEVIIIDSGSTDSSLDIIKNYPLRLVEIPAKDFGHGKTRNLGARLARGDTVVFLNADAIPMDNFWLINLIDNFKKADSIAGVYGRILPQEDCNPLRAREILNDRTYFRETKIKYIADRNSYRKMAYGEKRILFAFETISCAINKAILLKFPFQDDIEFGEDLEWGKRIIESDFKIVFEPSSQVIHSHDFYCSFSRTVKKYFDDAKLNKDLLGYSIGVTPWFFLDFMTTRLTMDIKYIFGLDKGIFYKVKWVLYSPLARLCQFMGVVLGCYSQRVPLRFHRRISLVSEVKNSSKKLWA